MDNIEILNNATQENKEAWGINLSDGTISPLRYYKFRLLNQYCFEIRKMTFASLLKDSTSEQTITNDMNKWFEEQKNIEK